MGLGLLHLQRRPKCQRDLHRNVVTPALSRALGEWGGQIPIWRALRPSTTREENRRKYQARLATRQSWRRQIDTLAPRHRAMSPNQGYKIPTPSYERTLPQRGERMAIQSLIDHITSATNQS